MCVVYRSAITMPKDFMSEQQINIEFVKEVEKHPTLYDFGLASYSRKDISDQAWEEVSKATNMTPSACRERWRNLRAVFMRTMKAPPRGSTGKKKPYYLAEAMQFVVPFMRPLINAQAALGSNQISRDEVTKTKETENEEPVLIKVENIDEEEIDEWETQSTEEVRQTQKRPLAEPAEYYPPKKICHMVHPSSSVSNPDDEHVKSFLNSLVPELNEMNSSQFKHFKRRVLVLIDDIMTEIPSSASNKDNYIMSTLCKTNFNDESF